MRIISGKHKGKRIQAPSNLPVRPTADMQKEALFNIINNYYNFDQIALLDLFAGTGNISYEFASRGTPEITAVDVHFGCVHFIQKTAKELNFDILTIKSDVFSFLEKSNQKYDLIFADPPYDLDLKLFERIPQLVFDKELLTDVGMLIVEHSKHTSLEKTPHFSFQKNYGGSVFSFFEVISKI